MLGQAGRTLEKQIARSDALGDQHPARKLGSEREEPSRCKPVEVGGSFRPSSIAASGGDAGGFLVSSPSRAVHPGGLIAWALEAAGPHREGEIPSVVEGSEPQRGARTRLAPTQHP
jgi:hypothetical protein